MAGRSRARVPKRVIDRLEHSLGGDVGHAAPTWRRSAARDLHCRKTPRHAVQARQARSFDREDLGPRMNEAFGLRERKQYDTRHSRGLRVVERTGVVPDEEIAGRENGCRFADRQLADEIVIRLVLRDAQVFMLTDEDDFGAGIEQGLRNVMPALDGPVSEWIDEVGADRDPRAALGR